MQQEAKNTFSLPLTPKQKAHAEAYSAIKELLGSIPFSFRMIGENGNKQHLFAMLPERAKKLKLPHRIIDDDPWAVHMGVLAHCRQ